MHALPTCSLFLCTENILHSQLSHLLLFLLSVLEMYATIIVLISALFFFTLRSFDYVVEEFEIFATYR